MKKLSIKDFRDEIINQGVDFEAVEKWWKLKPNIDLEKVSKDVKLGVKAIVILFKRYELVSKNLTNTREYVNYIKSLLTEKELLEMGGYEQEVQTLVDVVEEMTEMYVTMQHTHDEIYKKELERFEKAKSTSKNLSSKLGVK